MEQILNPLYLILIYLIVFILNGINSVIKGTILRKRIIFCGINIAVIILFFGLFNFEDTKDLKIFIYSYIIYMVFSYLYLLLTIIYMIINLNNKLKQSQIILDSLKDSQQLAYYIVDKKDRIKGISKTLLKELNLPFSDCFKKPLFDVFDDSIRFIKINDLPINNEKARIRYANLRKSADSKEDLYEKITFLNYQGTEVSIQMTNTLLFTFGKYSGRMAVGQIRAKEELLGIEKELAHYKNRALLMQKNFFNLMEISSEPIFFNNLTKKTIWINDVLKAKLGLVNDEYPIDVFRGKFEATDLEKYLQVIAVLTPDNPDYKVRYRYILNGKLTWIQEKGRRIFDDQANQLILGNCDIINEGHIHQRTDLALLDKALDDQDFLNDTKRLILENKPFALMIIRLKNIPKINDQYGRKIGNLLMNSYLEKVSKNLLTSASSLYRLSGLTFALVITEFYKLAFLKEEGLNLLSLEFEYGAIKTVLKVCAGISMFPKDATNERDLAIKAYNALDEALKKDDECCLFYKDLKKEDILWL